MRYDDDNPTYRSPYKGNNSFESDPSMPVRAHMRTFQTPELLDVTDYGVTGQYGGDTLSLGRQRLSKNDNEENPNLKYQQAMDYAQYGTPFYKGSLNARAMKSPNQPSVQAMLQYIQEMGGGTAGIGLMGNRTPDGDKLRALQMMYNKRIDDTSDISGMAVVPFNNKPQFNIQYRKRFSNGGQANSDDYEYGRPIESPPQYGVLPQTFPKIVGEDSESIKRRLANVSAMNLANPNYTKGLDRIVVKTPEDRVYGNNLPASRVAGYYDPENANEVVLSPTIGNINNFQDVPMSVAHEAQHLQDLQSLRYRQKPLQKLNKDYLQARIENNFQRAKESYPEYRKLNTGYYNDKNAPFSERLADFAGYEAALPSGQRLVDTPFGKDVFNTPELQNYYHASVRPMEQKMIPTLPSMVDKNPFLNVAKQVQTLSKEKLKEFEARINAGESYADALYKTLMGAKF